MDTNDPEGCAPKDLFTWMAARYPVQSNFRPSASQALQKAYKRGRLEKSSNNKYRINAAWEGGNVRALLDFVPSVPWLISFLIYRLRAEQRAVRKPILIR